MQAWASKNKASWSKMTIASLQNEDEEVTSKKSQRNIQIEEVNVTGDSDEEDNEEDKQDDDDEEQEELQIEENDVPFAKVCLLFICQFKFFLEKKTTKSSCTSFNSRVFSSTSFCSTIFCSYFCCSSWW